MLLSKRLGGMEEAANALQRELLDAQEALARQHDEHEAAQSAAAGQLAAAAAAVEAAEARAAEAAAAVETAEARARALQVGGGRAGVAQACHQRTSKHGWGGRGGQGRSSRALPSRFSRPALIRWQAFRCALNLQADVEALAQQKKHVEVQLAQRDEELNGGWRAEASGARGQGLGGLQACRASCPLPNSCGPHGGRTSMHTYEHTPGACASCRAHAHVQR